MDKDSTILTINEKNIAGMLGSRNRGGRMEGADESTELWRHPYIKELLDSCLVQITDDNI